MSDLPECFRHRLLNTPWNDRHMRALQHLVEHEYTSAADVGIAAGLGLRTDGQPLNRLGAAKHGGRIISDLMRLGFARGTRPYQDARGYYTATKEGIALVTKGPLRYAVERAAQSPGDAEAQGGTDA